MLWHPPSEYLLPFEQDVDAWIMRLKACLQTTGFVLVPNVQAWPNLDSLRRQIAQSLWEQWHFLLRSYLDDQHFTFKLFEAELDAFSSSERMFYEKPLHWDLLSPVVILTYFQPQNVQGGIPIVANCKQFCRDHRLQLQDIIEFETLGFTPAVRPEYREQILTQYSISLPDACQEGAMLILNNLPFEAGLAHGVQLAERIVPQNSASRKVHYTSFHCYDQQSHNAWRAHLLSNDNLLQV